MKSPLATLVLCLLTSLNASAAPQLSTTPHDFESPDGEIIPAELGEFQVPENRGDPNSRQITLKFVRFASASENPGPPIVYLAGGPGGSGIRTAGGTRFPLFMALREYGDVIAFDQRGTGISGFEELDCDDRFMIPFDQPMDATESAGHIARATKGCVQRLRDSGIDLSAYNTRESAADLNDLRLALGADKLTLWGISYGTHLALATMKYHGEFVESAILAGVEGLHHSWKLPSDQQALMEEIARQAKQDPAVHAVVPDLLGSIQQLLEDLEREPKLVTVPDPRGFTLKVAVGKFDLQYALARSLRGPSQFVAMPDAVARLQAGDWLELALASGQVRMGEGVHGMSLAMDCASGASGDWLERIAHEAESTLLGDAINFPFPTLCDGMDIADLGDEFREPLRSDVPTLLISGTLDGRTPVGNGDEVAEHLSHVQHLVIEGAGHSDPLFLSSPRILECMQAFLANSEIPTDRIELPPLQFIAPRALATLSEEQLDRFAGTYRIDEDSTRRIVRAGNLLYSQRGRGRMLPIRPTSETTFFYVGSATHLKFEIGDGGAVTAMVVYHEGSDEGERATRE